MITITSNNIAKHNFHDSIHLQTNTIGYVTEVLNTNLVFVVNMLNTNIIEHYVGYQ